jgi:hypothetical protein
MFSSAHKQSPSSEALGSIVLHVKIRHVGPFLVADERMPDPRDTLSDDACFSVGITSVHSER